MLTSFSPVIAAACLEESRVFYAELFGFKTVYETQWCVGLGRPEPSPYELLLLDHTHPALPKALELPVRAVRITLEVIAGQGDWTGVVTDPGGVRIDVVTAQRSV